LKLHEASGSGLRSFDERFRLYQYVIKQVSFTVVLYAWGDQPRLQRAAADVAKIFGNHEAALIRETYNALNAYLSIIPGNQAFNLRRTWLLSGQLC
jgi:type IV secretory pathway VirB4 component